MRHKKELVAVILRDDLLVLLRSVVANNANNAYSCNWGLVAHLEINFRPSCLEVLIMVVIYVIHGWNVKIERLLVDPTSTASFIETVEVVPLLNHVLHLFLHLLHVVPHVLDLHLQTLLVLLPSQSTLDSIPRIHLKTGSKFALQVYYLSCFADVSFWTS